MKQQTRNQNNDDRGTHWRQFRVGHRGRILGYEPGAKAYRQKLLAMGLTPGVEFTVSQIAPLGDPIAVHVRGFTLSLRKGEAQAIRVQRLDYHNP